MCLFIFFYKQNVVKQLVLQAPVLTVCIAYIYVIYTLLMAELVKLNFLLTYLSKIKKFVFYEHILEILQTKDSFTNFFRNKIIFIFCAKSLLSFIYTKCAHKIDLLKISNKKR